jgi:flagellar biosynthetic protein FlhB
MSGDSGGEKVFDPTPQKLAEARRKGDVPRSTDVTAAATYLALLAVVGTVGAFAVAHAASVLLIFIAQPDRLAGLVLGPGGPALGGAIMGEALVALAPLFLVPIAAVLISLVAQQAIVFSGDKIAPKLDRISLLANARRKFGAAGLVEFAKALVKLAAISVALFVYLSRDLDRMIGAATAEARVLGAMLMDSLAVLLTITCVIAVTIAAIDLAWQRFEHTRRLRMSHQDMREESRQSDGDPHMKA